MRNKLAAFIFCESDITAEETRHLMKQFFAGDLTPQDITSEAAEVELYQSKINWLSSNKVKAVTLGLDNKGAYTFFGVAGGYTYLITPCEHDNFESMINAVGVKNAK